MQPNMSNVIEESFSQYAGAVLQSRALVDVRDCLKPSARQIFYCLYTDKFLHSKPFKKTLKGIGSAMRVYIHGDSSCEGVIMRAGQPFSMRYPLVEVDGSFGNLMESANWAAPRYTSSRLSEVSNYLFGSIEKDTIKEWRDNYDDTEQYPAVLPSKGFYNIVNPTMGIGVGAACSIPGFNIVEVNNALITLLKNPDCDFEDIYCPPDFPTGAILLNESEVKESLRVGTGKACKIRSVIEYDAKENCLIVKEIPFGVYTNTICEELDKILNSEENYGIEKFIDLTATTPNIKIFLTKKANPAQVAKKLYKETSLQSHFGINMTMLEDGRFPRVFSWKEALSAHIQHEKEVYKRGYEFDLKKVQARIHIVEGIIIALNNIEEVISTIKTSQNSAQASERLQSKFNLSEIQAKAILDIKLARLAHLEVQKFYDELKDLEAKREELIFLLENKEAFEKEIIKGWQEVIAKFGDERRTKITNIESEDDEEPVEKKQIITYLTNHNNLYAYEDSTLITQKKGGVGTKFKLNPGEMVINTISGSNSNDILLFTNKGKVYNYNLNNVPLNEKTSIFSIIPIEDGEVVTSIITNKDAKVSDHILIVTKNGTVKRTARSKFKTTRAKGIASIKLKEGDEIKSVFLVKQNDNLAIVTKMGYYISFPVAEIPATDRLSMGVKGITLRPGDEIADAAIIDSNTRELLTITRQGMAKKTSMEEFDITHRANKGFIIHKVQEEDELASICALGEEDGNIVVSSKNSCIKFSLKEVQTSGRNTIGTKVIKLFEGNHVTGVTRE